MLPVGISDKCQTAIVPRHLPQNGKDKEQHLQTKHFLLEQCVTEQYSFQNKSLTNDNISVLFEPHFYQKICLVCVYQEAHKVKGQYGWHPPEGQPLQHSAADAGGVTVIFGASLGRAVVPTTAWLATAKYRHGEDPNSEHAHSCILAENLKKEMYSCIKISLVPWKYFLYFHCQAYYCFTAVRLSG